LIRAPPALPDRARVIRPDTVSAWPALIPHNGSLLFEGLGRCPRRASSRFHPKRQTPFRVKGEREDGVAFSVPRSRLMLAHPMLAAKAGLPRSAAQQPEAESDDHRRLRAHQQPSRERVRERSPPRAQTVECRVRCRADRERGTSKAGCEQCRSIATARLCRSPPSVTCDAPTPNSGPPIGPSIVSPTAMSRSPSICPPRTAIRPQSAGNCSAGSNT
jgi:hypothetical protein